LKRERGIAEDQQPRLGLLGGIPKMGKGQNDNRSLGNMSNKDFNQPKLAAAGGQ
jgi:hypothetical protein